MSSLSHHGIKGQRWGVRRYQNKDGTRTAAGKKRYSVEAVDVNSSRKEIKKLVKGFSRKDKEFFFGRRYWDDDYDKGTSEEEAYFGVKKRFVIKEGKDIVAFIDAQQTSEWNSELNMVIGTKASARGKGYASALAEKMVDWYDSEGYKSHEGLRWQAANENTGSRKIAEKTGFKQIDDDGLFDDEAVYAYSKNGKQELDKLAKEYANKKSVGKEVKDKINSDFKTTRISKLNPTTEIEPYGWVRSNKGESEWSRMKANLVDAYAERWVKKKHSDDLSRYDKASSSYGKAMSNYYKKRKVKHTSIGGTMYIEGNALILGDSSYLEHHGILGQRWGVRRFQNKDGTRTAAGKARDQKNAAKTVKNAKLFRASANAFQGTKFGYGANKRALKEEKAYGDMAYEILNKGKNKAEYDDLSRDINSVASFEYEEYSKKRDAMIEINARISLEMGGITNPSDEQVAEEWVYWADFDEDWGADLKGNSYDRYLVSKGYNPNEIHKRYKDDYAKLRDLASKDADEYLGPYGDTKITYKDKYSKEIVKTTAKEELANKIVDEATMWIDDYGAANRADLVYTDKELDEMRAENAKYSPLKHSALFIEDGTLYLSHHGIRGQRWGVRRFQNRDGSLTNAGRKRLGYATKGAAQAVGKAFKAGVKVGGNAVKAAKAHHEKKEAEKLEKKKEKASKTRLGVMANKDLFTDAELKKLNDRFKLEDEMKLATLQKGVEIAKAVGVIAQNVGSVAKAYEDVTGTSLSPIKKAKQEAEAKEKAEDRKRKLAKEDADAKRAEDKEKRDIEDRERRIKFEDEDRVRKQAREDADAQRAENAEKRAQAKEQRDSSMAVELQRKAKAAADEQEHKAVKAKAESRSAILDVLDKIDKIRDDDDDHNNNNPPGGGIDTWNDDDYLNFFKKTGIIHSDISDPSLIQNGVLFVDSSDGLAHHGVKGQRWGVRRFQNADGSLTDKGRKHYEKAIEKLDRKQVNSDNRRGRLERQHPFAVTASAILTGSAYAALMVASAANPAMVVAGSAIAAAVSALGTHVDYSIAEAWEGRGTKRRQKKRKEYEEMLNHDGLIVSDGTLYLEHHGIKGQRWGVRRFQNADGTRTEAGKKHDAKLAAKAERKQAKADMKAAKAAAKAKAKDIKLTEKAENLRKREIERYEKKAVQQPRYKEAYEIMSKHAKESDRSELLQINRAANIRGTGQAIVSALVLSTFVPTPIAVAGGIAVAKAMKMNNVDYARTVTTNARLNREARERKLKEAQSIKLEHSSAYGMPIQNGTLFINADEPYLEHHGVLGMKWGKHLRAGKGPADAPASAGGGGGEDDEKLKEMAKKAGMSVAEYKQKFASKIGGAASKVGEKVYDAAGGSHKKNAEGWRKMAREESNAARASERSSHENSARAASQDRKYGSGGDVYRRAADSDKENAETHRSNAKARSERAASEQAAYEKSLAGKYDKMKADRARKKSAKEKKRLQTHTSAEAKRISVKDRHLIINGNRSSGTRGLAVGETGEKPKSFKEKAYDALGGKYKTQAADAHREMIQKRNDADDKARRANAQGRAANANKKAGNVREYMANKEGARQLDKEAKGARLDQWDVTTKANRAQWKYDHSIAGLYDKATGKYKQVHKRTKVPKMMDQAAYYYKEGSNSKLHNNGSSKEKTAKDQAKAAVWDAADHQIKAKEYRDEADMNASAREARLAEGSYRRATALGKQASRETSTSFRPRARKKKHTSGGSGVTVRRPGRKPVSRTKRVTQSSTGVKRRSATGTGARVRRGA